MRFLLMALILAATLFAWTAPTPSGALYEGPAAYLGASGDGIISCSISTSNNPATCAAYVGVTFQLTLTATAVPDEGYDGFYLTIHEECHRPADACPSNWFTYLPRDSCNDEVLWPDVNQCSVTNYLPTGLTFGASVGATEPGGMTSFVGKLLELDMRCNEPGVYEAAFFIDAVFYAQVALVLEDPTRDQVVKAKINNEQQRLNINCYERQSTPTPVLTPAPPSTPTPDEPQPTPPASAVVLDFDTYPERDWELVSSGGSSTVSGGILTINAPNGTYHEFSLPHPDGLWHQEVSNSRGWVIETRMRVDPVTTAPCDYGLKIWANDHTNPIEVGFSAEDVCLIYPDMVRYPMDTTDGFHVYRIESRLDNVKVYVDGDLVIEHTRTWQGGGGDILMFGDGSVAADNSTLSYWDYFWYDVTPDVTAADPPPTPTPVPTSTPTPDEPRPTPTPVRGDANCDGITDAIDAALILQYVAGFFASLPCPENADAAPDGNINSVDALFVLQMVAGMFNECCAGLPDFPPDVLPQPTDTPVPTESRPERSNCHPSYHGVCLDPNALDYDCAGGTGNGPRWVDGPITVVGPDKFGLDRDGDGVGCE